MVAPGQRHLDRPGRGRASQRAHAPPPEAAEHRTRPPRRAVLRRATRARRLPQSLRGAPRTRHCRAQRLCVGPPQPAHQDLRGPGRGVPRTERTRLHRAVHHRADRRSRPVGPAEIEESMRPDELPQGYCWPEPRSPVQSTEQNLPTQRGGTTRTNTPGQRWCPTTPAEDGPGPRFYALARTATVTFARPSLSTELRRTG